MLRKAKLKKLILLSVAVLSLMIVLALSPLICSKGDEIQFEQQLQAPSLHHLLGTDNFGRDMLQRILSGLKLSLALAVVIEGICLAIGALVGLITGYYRGLVDELFVQIVSVLMAFPGMIMALCMIAILGPGLTPLVLAISLTGWTTYARLIRSEVISLKEKDYIMGVRAAGASNSYILFKHIFINVLIPVIPLATLMIGHSVLMISSLSFLGFGVQPPTPEIGNILKESITYLDSAPWLMLFPGLALATSVLLFNLLGDELRDVLDYKRRGSGYGGEING